MLAPLRGSRVIFRQRQATMDVMTLIKYLTREPSDLVKFCMVLQGLPRTILLLNFSTLIYIQDDALDSLLQCFTSPRTLITCLDGIIRYYLHDLSQETGGKFSPCKAQPCLFSSNMLRQRSIHMHTCVAQF